MTTLQEDALYDFLENATDTFTLDDVVSFIRLVDSSDHKRLSIEIPSLISARNLAFYVDKKYLISRRGCFEQVLFVISPSRMEIMNGILIPGHRCIPFANPMLLPHEYTFYWDGREIPFGMTEGPPTEFYPYYNLFGEEFAHQYIARDNPDNENAFNMEPFEDPHEVSIHTLDMRSIYRESAFVPGDVFSVKTIDWKSGSFSLERVPKDSWPQAELYAWFEAAELGFKTAFELKGPCSSTEEQISYAYWYGGSRMRELPAYALDDFINSRTDQVETVPYGIESRFWYAGKEIPDEVHYYSDQAPPDRTLIEEVLFRHGIPISEYVIQSYVRDSLFRKEADSGAIMNRVVPPIVASNLNRDEIKYIQRYISEVYEELKLPNSDHIDDFVERAIGPVRQRLAELHSAVVDMIARLKQAEVDSSWFPKHTFVILFQIQGHAANALEDFGIDAPLEDTEIYYIENFLDSIIETYEEMRSLIDEGIENYRRRNMSVVKPEKKAGEDSSSHITIQAALSGTDVWRRFSAPGGYTLEEIHNIIQVLFGWTGKYPHRFIIENRSQSFTPGEALDTDIRLNVLHYQGAMELVYEYGNQWMVRLLLLSAQNENEPQRARCIAAAGAAPPETLGGPLRYRRFISILRHDGGQEKALAQKELGPGFDPDSFNMDACNKRLEAISGKKSAK